jgi:hypothetical protein
MTAAALVTAGAGDVLPSPSLAREARESAMILLWYGGGGAAGRTASQNVRPQLILTFNRLNTSHHSVFAGESQRRAALPQE